ncbi:PstS family phosphate ABC transporter substrate-binding protein [Thalassobius sp. MITS945101]|uniref:PstS family phosphate ABC transporter substrate-binding protein n=1 Tax=Thalassobius sp. MITS945101 TaxID=3096994 RepID=UPI00399A85D8
MFFKKTLTIPFLTTLTLTASGASAANAPIELVGSTTVYPYAAISADTFVENHDFAYPEVAPVGSTEGISSFCTETGSADIALSSRKIKATELATCATNGVTKIIEVKIGYDGLVFANSRDNPRFDFTPADWFLALAAEVPSSEGLIANTAETWQQVNTSLPDIKIRTILPAPHFGTREVFDKKMMLQGCKDSGAFALMMSANDGDAAAASQDCLTLRTGPFVTEEQGSMHDVVPVVASSDTAIAVTSLGLFESNARDLRASRINGVIPSNETIANGAYPVSRPMFMYVKQGNIGIKPGLKEYVQTVVSDELSGPEGFLTNFGLVPDPDLAATQQRVAQEEVMRLSN